MIKLSTNKPSSITNLPAGLTNRLFGSFELSGLQFFVVLATKGKSQQLIVDSNSNGNFKDAAPVEWPAKGGTVPASGQAEVKIRFDGHRASCNMVFFQLGAKSLMVQADYGFAGQLKLGKTDVRFILMDSLGDGFKTPGVGAGANTLEFDRKNNGQFRAKGNVYDSGFPFTINGSSYLLKSVSLDHATATFVPSEKVAEIPLPVALTPGAQAPEFSMTGLEGKQFQFPADYHSRLVLIYAWSTASTPSLAWLPRVRKLYDANNSNGFDVLGICLDAKSNTAAASTQGTQMPWTTGFDGRSWRSPIASALGIDALPYLLLVDGTSGKVVATMSEMVGDGLEKAVAGALHQ